MSIRCRFEFHKPDYPKKGQEYYASELRGKVVKCIRCGREGYYNGYGIEIVWKKLA